MVWHKTCYTIRAGGGWLSLVGIGTKLRQAREAQGLSIDNIAGPTRIQPRYLEAIEAEDLEALPGLVFARNFVRQYAVALKLDPEPLLASLPKLDESRVQLPVPPKIPRSRRFDSRSKSLLTSVAWLVALTGGITAAYRYIDYRFHRPLNRHEIATVQAAAVPVVKPPAAPEAPPATAAGKLDPTPVVASPVQVVVTAHEATWVSLAADGKSSFAGTLRPNETKEISAAEQVKLIAGNAGGVTVSLNGKMLDPIGPQGQVRVVKLTAEGPEFLGKVPRPVPDPL